MVTVQSFGSRIEADLAKGILESVGIHAFVSADDQGGLRPSMGFTSGVDLKVQAEDFEKAKAVLNDALAT